VVEAMLDADAGLLRSAYAGEASHETHQQGNCVLKVETLAKNRRFSDINFELYQGEILGIYGFMGAGITDVATCLFGYDHADHGAVYLDGKPVRIRKTAQAKKLGLAYVSDNRKMSIFPGKEVFKNITVAYLDRMLGWVLSRRVELAATDRQIRRVGVVPANPFLNITHLSGGNQQKVVLAKWLTYMPKVLILNEPTRGIDVGAKDEILHLIRHLREEGVSIILISSEPEIVLGNSDRILVMSKGRITKEFVNDGVTKDNLMKYA
jgi:ribose transport system ATP-binding protein